MILRNVSFSDTYTAKGFGLGVFLILISRKSLPEQYDSISFKQSLPQTMVQKTDF